MGNTPSGVLAIMAFERLSARLAFLFASYLVQLADDFAVLKFKKAGCGTAVLIEDQNDNVHFQQKIEYTDFPLEAITLFAGKDVDNWVIMLPSEY